MYDISLQNILEWKYKVVEKLWGKNSSKLYLSRVLESIILSYCPFTDFYFQMYWPQKKHFSCIFYICSHRHFNSL